MDTLGMDILGWDCSAPNDDFTDDFPSYDLMELNCCVVRDAYRCGDVVLWGDVLAFWDALPTQDRYAA